MLIPEKIEKIKFRNRLILTDEEIQQNVESFSRIYNESYTDSFVKSILSNIRKVWFRAEFIGFDEPQKRNNPDAPLIYATNHSGMSFPWDAIAFISKIVEDVKNSFDGIRALISPMLTKYPFMCPFMIDGLWWKAGCINANLLNFETAMKVNAGHILIFPEGIDGIGKGFDKRYKLQSFKTSFLRMSIRYKTDIVPFATVNGEYLNPWAYNFKKLSNLFKQIGMPFFPFGLIIFLAVLQPWIFYCCLPAKLIFVRGERIRAYDMIDKPYEEITQKDLKALGERVRVIMQHNLDECVKKYGQIHYNLKALVKAAWRNRKNFFRFFPPTWCLAMWGFDDNYKSDNKKSGSIFKLKTLFKHPIILAMYLPVLGWLFIGLKSRYILRKRDKSNATN